MILDPIYEFCDLAEKFQAQTLVKLSLLEAIIYAEVRLGKNTNKFTPHSASMMPRKARDTSQKLYSHQEKLGKSDIGIQLEICCDHVF